MKTMRRLSRAMVLIVATLCLAIGVPSDVEATHTWKIRIDNWGNPDKPSFWGSDSTIKVYIKVGSITTLAGTLPNPTGIHNFNFYVNDSNWPLASLDYVTILIDGENMFVIDQVEIFDKNGNLWESYGYDNMQGWCLSDDPGDGGGTECGSHGDSEGAYYFFSDGTVGW